MPVEVQAARGRGIGVHRMRLLLAFDGRNTPAERISALAGRMQPSIWAQGGLVVRPFGRGAHRVSGSPAIGLTL